MGGSVVLRLVTALRDEFFGAGAFFSSLFTSGTSSRILRLLLYTYILLLSQYDFLYFLHMLQNVSHRREIHT